MGRVAAAFEAVRGRRRTVALVLVALLVVAAALGAAVFLGTTYRADPAALDRLDAREDVTVERVDDDVIVRGGEVTDETVGLVFYPGARVRPAAYAPTLADLAAERDVLVVIPKMPLDLAVLDADAAADVAAAHPDVDRWVVGGHSLGGAMACRYAADDPGRVDGVVLFAAYCDDGDDLRGTGLAVLSVQGGADGVIDAATERANRDLLGSDATVVEVEGMNHAQFGAYGDQRGDDPPAIDDGEARARVVEATVEWFDDRVGTRERTGASPAAVAVSPADTVSTD
ncbi:alpha/beta fold hydrolase [Salinilacihabitans rarus]|uniref:alpha/beta fold hydrolase n=1 Tax=Salinilacihabitans rarus TaxID=2961596 RepID=UPI0020C8E7DD|nr:alpha/beta fold hydrolase [Salinilacihabitans rarus]